TAAVMPSVVTSGIPATASEQSAIITVKPAKTTAPPAVAVARAIDSRSSMPSPSCSLWRGGGEMARAGEAEERVVDAAAEPDHRRQRRRHSRHLEHVLEQFDDRQRADEPDQRADD